MTRLTKIEQWNMLGDVKRMRAEGMSEQSIANYVNSKHPDGKVSVMAIHRALGVVEKKKVEEQIQDNLNPADEFTREFREAVKNNTKEVISVIKECKSMLKDAKEHGEITDRIKAADVLLKGLTNERKNWESLQQFGTMKIDTLNRQAFEQKEQVNIMLNEWTNVIVGYLCPECKEKTIPKIIELVESDKEPEKDSTNNSKRN